MYAKAFEALDGGLQGVPTDAAPDAVLDVRGEPGFHELIDKCRARMTKLLLGALAASDRDALAAALAADSVAPGTLGRKALQARQARQTEVFLARRFGHFLPTATGWQPADQA